MTEQPHDMTPQDLADAERGRRLIAAAVAGERAPLVLREQIEAQRSQAARKPARRRWLAPLGASVAAVVAAIAVFGGGAADKVPSVAAVAGVSLRPATSAAPQTAPSNPKLLAAAVEGVAFPDWQAKFAWRASGQRSDTIEGRATRTVFYTNLKGATLGYSIVAGEALKVPDGRRVTVGATTLTVLDRGARRIVTWRRGGHTCVINAPSAVPAAKVLELATW